MSQHQSQNESQLVIEDLIKSESLLCLCTYLRKVVAREHLAPLRLIGCPHELKFYLSLSLRTPHVLQALRVRKRAPPPPSCFVVELDYDITSPYHCAPSLWRRTRHTS